MKALVLAAGLGTRLRPITDKIPKALVKISGQTLLEITLQKLIDSGASEIVVNVHHFADQIRDWIHNHPQSVPVHISDESQKLLNTGGALRKSFSLFSCNSEPILIHNVDILSNLKINDFYSACSRNDRAHLVVSHRKTSRQLLFNKDGLLVGWHNLETGQVRSPYDQLEIGECQSYAFSGIHLFGTNLYPLFSSFPESFSIIDFYLSVCHKIKIQAYPDSKLQLLDVGKLDSIQKAEDFLRQIKD